MKITENIYFYQGTHGGVRSWSNGVAIIGRKKKILIDSGPNLKIHLEKLFGAMAEDGIDTSQIDELWYTHGHPDHAGSAGVLSKKFHRKVRCHQKAQDILEASPVMKKFIVSFYASAVRNGKIFRTPSRLRRFLLKISTYGSFFYWVVYRCTAFALEKIFGEWLPVLGLEIFGEDGEIIKIEPDVQILFLPGHTPEEIGFWIKDRKILIIGDLINMTGFWLEKMPTLNNPRSSFNDTLASLKKIIELPIEILISGHGFFVEDKELIKNHLRNMVVNMEGHRDLVKELIEKNPKIKPDELSEIVLSDMPSVASYAEKRNYLEAILDDMGYYQKYK